MGKVKRIYRANSHASFGDDEAKWIGTVIEKYGGDFTKQQLVDEAAPVKSRGHSLFEWDDTVAGPLYRLKQAGDHLRMLHIEIVHLGEKKSVRAAYPVFVKNETEGARRSYASYDRVRQAPDLARQVIERAAHELKSWQRRYELYKSVFGSVFTAIEEMESELWPQQKVSTASRKTVTQTVRRRKPK